MKKYIVLSVFTLFAAALAAPVLRVHAADEIDTYCVAPTEAVPHGNTVSLTIKFSDSDKSNDFIVQGPFKILKYEKGIPVIVDFKRGNDKDDKGKENLEKPTLTFNVALSPKHKLPAPATEAATFTYYVTHKEGKRGNLSTTSREQTVDCSFTVQHEIENKTTPSGQGGDAQKNIVPADLGVTDVGTLPTSMWYFFKEWGRGLERLFTFKAVKKAELELRITNEKAAEALEVQTAKPDDAKALKSAFENYTKAQERLQTRIAELKETSENPDVGKLLEKLDGQTLKHANLMNQLAQRWISDPYAEDTMRNNSIGDPDFDLITNAVKDAQGKIQDTVVAATEKDKDIKEKATEQIKRAEDTISKLKDEYGIEPAGIAIDESGVPRSVLKGTKDVDNQAAEKTGPIRIDPTPARISTNVTIERQTPKRDFGDRMKAGLDTVGGILADAKAHLALATAAFADGKFGEAFGQARAAEVIAWKGLRLFTDKNGDGTMGKDELEKLPRPGTDADTPRIDDRPKSMTPPMPNIPLPQTVGDKPTQSNFSNIIDSSLNFTDDAVKTAGGGTATSTELNTIESQPGTVLPTVIVPSTLGR